VGLMSESSFQNLPCSGCKYFGFLRLVKHCRHPEHAEPTTPRRMLAIMSQGSKCAERIDIDAKVMAEDIPSWPWPVKLNQGG